MTDKVLLSSQAYNSADLRFVNQLIRTLAEQPKGIGIAYSFTQSSCIDVGLCIEATKFLETDFDWFFSLDFDIIFDPWNDPDYTCGREIKQLIASAKETGGLVVGPYLKKETNQLCCVPFKAESGVIGPGGGLVEMKWVPTGCTMISREILEKMAGTMELVEYDDKTHIYPFFLPMIYEENGKKTYLTHDYAFSQRVRDLGFKCYIDTRIVLGHRGPHTFVVPRMAGT